MSIDTSTDAAEITAEAQPGDADAAASSEELVEDELLVEEVSIDGMCGVY